ncbi:hypothetical protein niasHT_006736 [Heterodera trifolii]|uniref:HEAT repeat-containing protein 1 n=1 Tax=Heterodera trifolii TaxID=157864 RepID=A0ABD2LYL5_9BILA
MAACHFEKLLRDFSFQISPPENDKKISVDNRSLPQQNDTFLQIEQCVREMLVEKENRRDLFHCSLRPALGHFVALLLHSFGNDSDVNLRLRSGEFLCLLTQLDFADESADFVAFVLPGIFSGCRQILLNVLPNLHSIELIRCACELVTNSICISFSKINVTDCLSVSVGKCVKSPSSENVLSFRRDSNWLQMAAQRILPQIGSLLSHLSAHSVDSVRYESANILSKIRRQIPSDCFGSSFIKMTIDVSLLLYSDTMPKTRQLAHRIIDDVRLQQKELFESHSLDKLKKAMKSLESDVKNASDGGVYIQNFVNCAQLVGPHLLGRLFNLPEFVDKFLSPLIRLISVDHNKEMICDSLHHKTNGLQNLPPLKYGINGNHLTKLATLIDETHNSEKLFDWCFDNFHFDRSVGRRLSIAYFSFFMLNSRGKSNQSVGPFVDDVLRMLASMECLLEDEVTDHRIANSPFVNSTESSLAQLLLHCLSTFRSLPDHPFSSRLHIDVVYELLKWCSSSNFCVKNAAESALSLFAELNGHPNVSLLLQCHAEQIVFKLSMDSRDFSVCPRFPLIFAELVSRCFSLQIILPQIRSVVAELLLWLDRSDQKRIIILAKALRAYLSALNEWFPNLKPSNEKYANLDETEAENDGHGEEEEKLDGHKKQWKGEPNYPLVKDVVSILNRTKHFISSAHLPLLLIVLDVLRLSLLFVRNYEDELLPMIHQNWMGLIRLFEIGTGGHLLDSQKLIMIKAIEVVSCICKLSKDFVYRKIVHEFIPCTVVLLRALLKESQNLGKLYAQTATFKLQCAILDGVPDILGTAKVAPEHFEQLEEIIAEYAKKERKLTKQLRNKALTSLNHIEKLKR